MRKKLIGIVSLLLLFSIVLVACTGNESIKKYTVSFNTNGGNVIESIQVEENKTVTKPTDPTKEGFNFKGWFSDSHLTQEYKFTELVTADITLNAKWEEKTTNPIDPEKTKYTVTFNTNGGSEIANVEVDEDTTLERPEEPTKTGYTFIGWFSDEQTEIEYNFANTITQDLTLYAKWEKVEVYFTVIFNTNGGSTIANVSVGENAVIAKPADPTKSGFVFSGWYSDSTLSTKFNFTDRITKNITLYAKWVTTVAEEIVEYGSFKESMYLTWGESNAKLAKVYYQLSSDTTWTQVDSELVRKDEENPALARVDIVGIKKGTYSVKIVTSSNKDLIADNMVVTNYDRSGYAHYNYTEGVGGYNDDGTLKANAIVVYVTEENKDTITIDGVTGTGIGWILNNAQYSKSGSNTYNADDANNSLSSLNIPLVIRIIGTVTPPQGLTIYNSLDQGGSKGDNGFMARMKDANNVTIEGIGEGAKIYGWGIHFMATSAGRGIGFEVRNLTFDAYPEDAIGMEGVQESINGETVLTSPVERCWIHNVTFLPGYCANPAESDKAEGDGSCDFKRGRYYTVSYCKFVDAHKTNLIGASKDNLQYNITMHHNWWQNCEGRIPLARKANIHMYNNYFEIADGSMTPSGYVQDARADAYIFSEANYFYAANDPTTTNKEGGGAIKSYADVRYSVRGIDHAIIVQNRDELIANSNKYPTFDTDNNIFYYNELNKVSDVEYLTDAVQARIDCIANSGAFKSNKTITDGKIYSTTPTVITESIQETTSQKIAKGIPLLIFELNTRAEFSMVTDMSKTPAVLVDIYGRTMLFGTGTVVLDAGIYVIESSITHGSSKGSSQAKEATVTSYKIELDSSAAKQARIDAAQTAFANLPALVEYTQAHFDLLQTAQTAYDSLLDSDEQSHVNLNDLQTAWSSYVSVGVIYVQDLINLIGTVNENSYTVIKDARDAYDNALADIQSGINNYNVLEQAESDFANYAVINVNNQITALVDVALIDVADRTSLEQAIEDYNIVLMAYNSLIASQKEQVVNILKVTNGLDILNAEYEVFEVIDIITTIVIEDITLSNHQDVMIAKNLFDSFTDTQKARVSAELQQKLDDAYAKYQELANTTITHNFNNGNFVSDFFEFSGNLAAKNGKTLEVNGMTITNPLKIDSKPLITFTTTAPMKLTIYISTEKADSKLKIDDVLYDIIDNKIEVELESGTHNVKQGKNETWIFYMMLEPMV